MESSISWIVHEFMQIKYLVKLHQFEQVDCFKYENNTETSESDCS